MLSEVEVEQENKTKTSWVELVFEVFIIQFLRQECLFQFTFFSADLTLPHTFARVWEEEPEVQERQRSKEEQVWTHAWSERREELYVYFNFLLLF